MFTKDQRRQNQVEVHPQEAEAIRQVRKGVRQDLIRRHQDQAVDHQVLDLLQGDQVAEEDKKI